MQPARPIHDGDLATSFDDSTVFIQADMEHFRKMWDEVGGAVLTCGPHTINGCDWDTKMVCDLVCEERAKSSHGDIPMVVLEDGREAYVVTIGTPESIMKTKPTVVQRCLAKGDVYG